MKRNHFFCLLIILLTLVAYSNSFENSFHHDDIHTIVRNPFVKEIGKLPQFFVNPQMGSGIYGITTSYRPLLMATFALNYHFHGVRVFGYHLFNIILHLICTVLVYFVILYIFRFAKITEDFSCLRNQMTALFAALLFGLHPVQTESVTYITGRSSLLTGLFFLGSFFTYIQYGLNLRIRYLVASFLFYALALLVKETAITLLAILLLFNMMFLHGSNFKSRYLSLFPHFLVSFFYLVIRIYFFGFLQYGSQSGVQAIRPFYDHLLSQSRAWVHYLGILLLPLNLNVDYDFSVSRSILENEVILSLLLLTTGSLLIWRLSRSNRILGFFALWFAITLLPTNSLIVLEDLVSDRWLFLPSVGYAAIMAYAVSWIFQTVVGGRGRAAKMVFFFLCALVVELYGFSTLLRNFTWTSERTLWEDAVAKSPNKARPYDALGLALATEGRLEEARQSLQRAISLSPQGGQAYINLGYVYMRQGKMEEALEIYERAIPFNPLLLSEIYNNIGSIYLKMGRKEECERTLRKAIDIRPHHAAPYYNLGVYYEERGDVDQAILYYEKAAKLSPDYIPCLKSLIFLYNQKGLKEKSQEAYHHFLKYSPR